MRVGFNPHKDKPLEEEVFNHQVIIPVFIPNHEGYFKDSFQIFKRCVASLLATIHDRTFVTIVNNGSDALIVDYLAQLLRENKIHELITTQNIGKVNAILKGLAGNNIELVTIADSDVLFLSHWQQATDEVFKTIPKAGVVGIVPQYKTFMTRCENILWEKWYDKNLKLLPVKNPKALEHFYKSIGWNDWKPEFQNIALGYEASGGLKVYLGSGHFVATYKKDMFQEIVTYIGYKMGGLSEDYFDECPLKKDYWRLTTYDNFAYHMGNVYEAWMDQIEHSYDHTYQFSNNFPTYPTISRAEYLFKSKFLKMIFKSAKVRRLFFRYKKMQKNLLRKN
jgi:hypothetical protein